MTRVSGHGAMIRFWRPALLASAAAIGTPNCAEAALYYWQSAEPAFSQTEPVYQYRRQPKVHRTPVAKKQQPEKETGAKPQGPLIIAVSIDKQQVKIYDANGFFAEAPVSTGMRGHPTPMGVFSVIQKHKYHHSNIYSGAPMPYMQRITWSGVAMHAGVLPGYPASHGCIRMPMAFAIKMWNWTRMGARVIVSPGELAPSSFSHPLLAAFKVAPQPAAANASETGVPAAAKADKGAPDQKPAAPTQQLESGVTVGHADDVKSEIGSTPAAAPLRDQTHTADAGSDAAQAPRTTMSDAAPSEATGAEQPAATAQPATPGQKSAEIKLEAAKAEAKSENVNGAVGPDAKKDQGRLADADKPAATKPEPPKRAGQIAVFISRKDSKLYVRQNFAPLFSVDVTIAPSDRPLGTHIFTAEVDKIDANSLHWSVVSLPMSARSIRRADDEEHGSRRRRVAGGSAVENVTLPVPDGPAEALDRISVPADAMARVNEALTSGGSIIVSDQGINQGETGEGTDFIVSLR